MARYHLNLILCYHILLLTIVSGCGSSNSADLETADVEVLPGDETMSRNWTQSIAVSEADGASQILRFGLHETATNGIDASLGEVEMPPLPPAGAFDARFTDRTTGDIKGGVILDLRPDTANTQYTRTITFQRALGGDITISWDADQLATLTETAQLQDEFGGILIDVDMRLVDRIVITNTALTSLKLTFSTPEPLEAAAP